ncbi:hypothetical protein BOX15_Mlig002125g2, partial [Macrostomum lignano]
SSRILEKIIGSRAGHRGQTEYQAKFKSCAASASYVWATEADIITHCPQNRQLLEQFKRTNRHSRVLGADEAASALARKRSHQSLTEDQLAKRRHTSASSADKTPEYEQQPRHPPGSRRARIEKMCTARKRKEKLHSSTKEITGASLLQRTDPGRSRAPGPSGLVATRKGQQQPVLPDFQRSDSLAQALSRPSPVSSSAGALRQLCCSDAVAAASAKLAAKSASAPSLSNLQRLLAAGDPATLFAAASLASAATLNSKFAGSGRLLHSAARADRRSADLLLALLAAGAEADAAEASGITPLMLAAQAGDATAVHHLLHFGARPDTGGDQTASALLLAARSNHWDVAAGLLFHGAEFDQLLRRVTASQLASWTDRLAEPLLSALRRVTGRPSSFVSVQPPHLFGVAPGARCAFEFVSPEGLAETDTRLLLAGLMELNGRGGVRLRRVAGCQLLARLELNGRELEPEPSKDCLYVYRIDEVGAPPGQINRVHLVMRPECPARCRLRLVLLPAACTQPRGPDAGAA